jgi:hypothetical protein
VDHALELDVVEIAAIAGDELRILDALDPLAERSGSFDRHICHPYATGAARPSRMTAAASRMAATMFW